MHGANGTCSDFLVLTGVNKSCFDSILCDSEDHHDVRLSHNCQSATMVIFELEIHALYNWIRVQAKHETSVESYCISWLIGQWR